VFEQELVELKLMVKQSLSSPSVMVKYSGELTAYPAKWVHTGNPITNEKFKKILI
jgi:hypothetical protein